MWSVLWYTGLIDKVKGYIGLERVYRWNSGHTRTLYRAYKLIIELV